MVSLSICIFTIPFSSHEKMLLPIVKPLKSWIHPKHSWDENHRLLGLEGRGWRCLRHEVRRFQHCDALQSNLHATTSLQAEQSKLACVVIWTLQIMNGKHFENLIPFPLFSPHCPLSGAPKTQMWSYHVLTCNPPSPLFTCSLINKERHRMCEVMQPVHRWAFYVSKIMYGDFPCGAVVKNTPANAGDMCSSPGPGRSHIPRSN